MTNRISRLARTAALGTVLMASRLAFAQAEVHGGEAGAHELPPIPPPNAGIVTGVTTLVVFALVLVVLAWKVWPAISKGLDERAAKIRSEIEAAELAQQQAREALQQYEKSLAQARAEAQKMLDHAKEQQQAIAAELKANADVELNQMRERAKKDIETAKRAALGEIYAEAANLATSIATKILRREIKPQDQQRLVQESLTELQTAGRN